MGMTGDHPPPPIHVHPDIGVTPVPGFTSIGRGALGYDCFVSHNDNGIAMYPYHFNVSDKGGIGDDPFPDPFSAVYLVELVVNDKVCRPEMVNGNGIAFQIRLCLSQIQFSHFSFDCRLVFFILRECCGR
jgi:hypothetical protein